MTLLELFKLMGQHKKLIITLPVICALCTALFSWLVLPNQYTSSVTMYVLTQTYSDSQAISSYDLSASQMLTSDMATLIQGDRVKNDTAKSLQLSSLDDYKIKITSSADTRLITISVTSDNAANSAVVANALAATTDKVATEVMDVKSVNIIYSARRENKPSGPPRVMYTAVAFLAGLFVAIAIVIIKDMTNTRIRKPEEVEELLDLPGIGRIPAVKL